MEASRTLDIIADHGEDTVSIEFRSPEIGDFE